MKSSGIYIVLGLLALQGASVARADEVFLAQPLLQGAKGVSGKASASSTLAVAINVAVLAAPTVPSTGRASNSAQLSQVGANNYTALTQTGSANLAVLSQQGRGNVAVLTQSGRTH